MMDLHLGILLGLIWWEWWNGRIRNLAHIPHRIKNRTIAWRSPLYSRLGIGASAILDLWWWLSLRFFSLVLRSYLHCWRILKEEEGRWRVFGPEERCCIILLDDEQGTFEHNLFTFRIDLWWYALQDTYFNSTLNIIPNSHIPLRSPLHPLPLECQPSIWLHTDPTFSSLSTRPRFSTLSKR